ncbi:nesprin-3 isoform X1 [Mugil cephalus]|uniref:nesprin-3 isoform X1 n=1 Tax=Mugil cephalus TaxID=48193 RepID=UPI001FB5A7B4|nr:nesprin-3 isoform X1 [Mugil cephalus]XP_047467215.1 nesprin-3 isoform X1 [Mugil cephalus]
MTQQEQQEFTEKLETAFSWMRAIQERLKSNDNTQGPREALEARLRETEKIHQSAHEGQMKMELALVAADNLLQSTDEELRNQTHAKLKDLKNLWDETHTYITHCHSRIEWVWLHWSEYLKACEEFEVWLISRQRSLAVEVELQLGVKEKLWQLDQHRVVVSDVQGQAALLERLLDEASALYSRTQDPSLEPHALERLQEAYNDVRDGAEERLSQLQKIVEEHENYQSRVQKFQSWLLSKTKELTDLMEREDTAENRLKALQALDDSVACEEKTLQQIEGLVDAVKAKTSPAGGEMVIEEAEELRLGWQRLRQGLCEAEEGLHSSLDSQSQYMARCQQLGEDIGRLRVFLQGLDQELKGTHESREHTDHTEEQMVGQWRKYTGVRNTLAGEESQVDHLKTQLKELFRFSGDSRHLSDDVLAVVKEHQSVKCRATRLCSESESGLRNILQDPLLVYAQWSHKVSHVLEASAEVTDFSHTAMLVQNIERLLKDSVQLQERFSLLQVKRDLLDSVFGPERSDGLQGELSTAIKNRELLHTQLLQRKSRLEGLISRTKDLGNAFDQITSELGSFRDRLVIADGLHPDILTKRSQSDQFKVIQKELEDFQGQIMALETLISSSQSNRTQFEKLCCEWKHLHKEVTAKVLESKKNIEDHESFHDNLLNLEKWLMVMKQKMESFHSPSGEWSIKGRQYEAERELVEFPEKELHLQQLEVQGQGVLEKTSEEGQVHILRDLKRIRDAWLTLYNMHLNLHRLLNSSTDQTQSGVGEVHGEGSLLRKEEEGAVTGQAGFIQDQREGYTILPGKSNDNLIPSKTVSGHSYQEDENDSFDYSLPSRAVDSATGRPESEKPTEGESGALDGDGGAESSTLASYDVEGRMDSKEDSMEARKGTSVRFRGDSGKKSSMTAIKHTTESKSHYESRRQMFEDWLSKENELLSGLLNTKESALSAKEVKMRQDTLKALRARVSWGQEMFQQLLQESQDIDTGSESAEDMGLEELRYRWILYKSKLKNMGGIKAKTSTKQKPGLLQRVCRLALPLWLLLLALLLLAFLLPLMDEGSSCSLSNNFARSFNIMLRYDGPPPT